MFKCEPFSPVHAFNLAPSRCADGVRADLAEESPLALLPVSALNQTETKAWTAGAFDPERTHACGRPAFASCGLHSNARFSAGARARRNFERAFTRGTV